MVYFYLSITFLVFSAVCRHQNQIFYETESVSAETRWEKKNTFSETSNLLPLWYSNKEYVRVWNILF